MSKQADHEVTRLSLENHAAMHLALTNHEVMRLALEKAREFVANELETRRNSFYDGISYLLDARSIPLDAGTTLRMIDAALERK